VEAQGSGRRELVGGLVLIDSAAYHGKLPPLFRLLRIPGIGPAILNLLPVPVMVRFVLTRIYHDRRSVTPVRIARYTEIYDSRESARVLVDSARQLIPPDYPCIVACYPEIEVPVLIVWGENDPVIPLADGVRLRHDIPGSRLAVIDACGHNPHEEKPEQTYAAIAEFLDRYARKSA
jgi:pimeloyl-ACP methyl ester carboxylesterase